MLLISEGLAHAYVCGATSCGNGAHGASRIMPNGPNAISAKSGQGSRVCENSDVELARRNFVSITLNRKRTVGQPRSRGDKAVNNSAHSLLAHVFTQPGS